MYPLKRIAAVVTQRRTFYDQWLDLDVEDLRPSGLTETQKKISRLLAEHHQPNTSVFRCRPWPRGLENTSPKRSEGIGHGTTCIDVPFAGARASNAFSPRRGGVRRGVSEFPEVPAREAAAGKPLARSTGRRCRQRRGLSRAAEFLDQFLAQRHDPLVRRAGPRRERLIIAFKSFQRRRHIRPVHHSRLGGRTRKELRVSRRLVRGGHDNPLPRRWSAGSESPRRPRSGGDRRPTWLAAGARRDPEAGTNPAPTGAPRPAREVRGGRPKARRPTRSRRRNRSRGRAPESGERRTERSRDRTVRIETPPLVHAAKHPGLLRPLHRPLVDGPEGVVVLDRD